MQLDTGSLVTSYSCSFTTALIGQHIFRLIINFLATIVFVGEKVSFPSPSFLLTAFLTLHFPTNPIIGLRRYCTCLTTAIMLVWKTHYYPLGIAHCNLLAAIFVMLKILRLLLAARIKLLNNGHLALMKIKAMTEACEAYWPILGL